MHSQVNWKQLALLLRNSWKRKPRWSRSRPRPAQPSSGIGIRVVETQIKAETGATDEDIIQMLSEEAPVEEAPVEEAPMEKVASEEDRKEALRGALAGIIGTNA